MKSDERERRRAQRAAIEGLALSQSSGAKELCETLREITESVADCLDVERVSVWRFTDEGDGLQCIDLYEASRHEHRAGAVLRATDHPAYFSSLDAQRALVVQDARTHEATRDFLADYLSPHGIGALLDAPIRVGGRLYGVVCHEHVGGLRHWSEDEIEFAGSVADLASLAITSDRLRRSEERLQLALDASDIGTFFWYPQSDRVVWDERTHRIYDWPAELFTGRTSDFVERVHPHDVPKLEAAVRGSVATGEPYRIEMRIVDREGTTRVIELRGQPFYQADGTLDHLGGTSFDVTERREMERRAYETQKLESLGLLAGGIAHDFNNLLVGMLGNASLALLDTAEPSSARQALEGIQSAAVQAGALCRQLLAYSGQGELVVEPVDLSALIEQTAELVQHSTKKGVTVTSRLAPELPAVEADATQLRQVLMNLIINASEAIPGAGTVTVSTEANRAVDPSAWPSGERLQPGAHVILSVVDDGPGIAPDVLARIFDPFFSTKGSGRGLGLAAVQGIVRSHGGALRVTSELGSGTRFEIALPVSDEEAVAAAGPFEAPAAATDAPVVLLVDDEPMVRRVGVAVLEHFGYEVAAAADATEALTVFSRDPTRYGVAVLDLTLPGADGLRLAHSLRGLRPELPILVASGFAREAMGAELSKLGRARFLQKPFRAEELIAALEAVRASTA